MTVRIGLIGGFTVSGDGAPDAVRGAIPQAILARLALAGGEVMSADALIADLWADPPSGVLSSLRAHVSRLRARGWAELLSGGREGYRVDAARVQTDVTRFEDFVRSPAADRSEALRTALGLWRLNPMAWAREFPFAAALDERLHELHRAAVMELSRSLMSTGENDAAARHLQSLVGIRPADAEAVSALSEALRAAGRMAEAAALLGDAVLHPGSDDPPDSASPPGSTAARGSGTGHAAVERHGVPVPATPFVGRAVELEAIRTGRHSARLITLTGPAGVGKTRLAIEAARRVAPGEDDVQWLVDLTAVPAAADVVAAVAEAVDASERTLSAIEQAISGRAGLLILDNAEHVLGAVATVCAELLSTCAGLGVLVTSRESLRMTGERVIAVAPLLGADLSDAVELFRQRAPGADGWTPEQTAGVERLCTMLDGLPLAIELAAARLDGLGIEDLTRSVSVGTSSGEETGRHTTIDAAIAWSVRLISPAERSLLSQLAGFAGSFSVAIVAAVCVVDGADAARLVVVLARRSLVQSIPGERGRFRLLRVVQQHVRRELPIVDVAAWQVRHAEWFLESARGADAALNTPAARAAKSTVRSLRDDLDQAMSGALARGDRRVAVGLAGALARFWADRGASSPALGLIDEALALPGPHLPDDEAAALRGAAAIAGVSGEPARVVAYAARYERAAAAASDPTHGMLACAVAACLAASTLDVGRTDALLDEAEQYRRAADERRAWAVPDYLVLRGDALRSVGRPAQALEVLGEAYRLASERDHTSARASASLVSGRTLIDVGRSDEALGILRAGVIRFLEHEDAPMALLCAEVFAVALTHLGRLTRAVELFGAVDGLGGRFGYRGNGVDPLFAEAARDRTRDGLAPARYDEAYRLGRTRSLPWLARNLTG